jgi:hypothetical protein
MGSSLASHFQGLLRDRIPANSGQSRSLIVRHIPDDDASIQRGIDPRDDADPLLSRLPIAAKTLERFGRQHVYKRRKNH